MAITFFGALRQQLREGAFARAQIGDHHRRHQLEQRFGHAFPGAARNVLAAELAGQFVEVGAHLVLPRRSARRRASESCSASGISAAACRSTPSICEKPLDRAPCFSRYKNVLAVAAVVHQAGLLQLRQVGGNAALAHGQNLLQLGHGKLLALQQQQDAEAAGIGQQAQGFED